MDRRVKRTRRALREALIQLMYEHEYDDIRVINITELADIALPTFYRHYENKLDLLKDLVTYFVEQVEAQNIGLQLNLDELLDLSQPPPLLSLFHLSATHRDFLQRLLRTPQSHQILQLTLTNFMHRIQADTPQWKPHEVELIASMTFGCLYHWVMKDTPESANDIAKIAHWTVVCGLMTLRDEIHRVKLPDEEQRTSLGFNDTFSGDESTIKK
ncbi:MAG: TetR/AcrR family transcriptional regulator [Chloroflexota bacterium]